ncbi:MAG: YdcF family protein [Edaphobacter sp.]|uniref:YdcF family protein n=1 Tax=Edaphobacter sp. TaxID=1934404 RepID=UPI0023A5D6B7|nr:YdcF family protein [Edaphobacter sp.]MDE1175434.1 YdcF family protein [Edaphobacter sp.]
MTVSDKKLRGSQPSAALVIARSLILALVLVGIGWSMYVAQQISAVADQDEAQKADAIAVFGAAEYAGRPSPTLHFRLDHAVDLYRMQIAPIVITLGGGADKDRGNTEGAVGRDYLLAHGIPFGNIIAETNSFDTEQQVHRLAAIAREYNLHHIVVVSDGTHLFRIREMCRDVNLDVYTSPRATVGHLGWFESAKRYLHEIASYTAWKLHLDVGLPRRWITGEDDF